MTHAQRAIARNASYFLFSKQTRVLVQTDYYGSHTSSPVTYLDVTTKAQVFIAEISKLSEPSVYTLYRINNSQRL